MKQLIDLLGEHKFRLLLLVFIFLTLVMGILVVPFEYGVRGSNILNIGDGIWWSVTTTTGVGYGDVYPVTGVGRLIGMILEVLGVVVLGLIVGHIAVALFRVRDEFYWKRVFERLDRMEEKLGVLEKSQRYLVKNNGHEEENNERGTENPRTSA